MNDYLLVEIPTLLMDNSYGIYPFYVDVTNMNEIAINELITVTTMETVQLPNIDLWPYRIYQKWNDSGVISLIDYNLCCSTVSNELDIKIETSDKFINSRMFSEPYFSHLYLDVDDTFIDSIVAMRDITFPGYTFELPSSFELSFKFAGGVKKRDPNRFYVKSKKAMSGGYIPNDDVDFYGGDDSELNSSTDTDDNGKGGSSEEEENEESGSESDEIISGGNVPNYIENSDTGLDNNNGGDLLFPSGNNVNIGGRGLNLEELYDLY